MNDYVLSAVPAVIFAVGAITMHLLVQRDEPAGMSHVVREVASAAVWRLLGARRPTARHRRAAKGGDAR